MSFKGYVLGLASYETMIIVPIHTIIDNGEWV